MAELIVIALLADQETGVGVWAVVTFDQDGDVIDQRLATPEEIPNASEQGAICECLVMVG